MCGILVGWTKNKSLNLDTFRSLLLKQVERGPDEQYFHQWQNFYFGFSRLKIINKKTDLSRLNSDEEDILVFLNGEIWNYKELGFQLGLKTPCSEYDVIREAYKVFGAKFVSHLNGMFSILLLDKTASKFYVYRDPVGIKPVFYFYNKHQGSLVISSDLRSILLWDNYRPSFNENYLLNRSLFGFSDYEDNLFCDIKQIPPSSYLEATLLFEGLDICQNSFDFIPNQKQIQEENFSEEYQYEILRASVYRCYEHSESYPLGVLLSGGIDSTLILLLLKEAGFKELICFYMGELNSPDYQWAKFIAESTGYKLHIITPNTSEIIKDLPVSCYRLSGMKALIIYYLAKKIKHFYPEMRILLCGEGSDEMYAGYPYHTRAGKVLQNFKEEMRRTCRDTSLTRKYKTMILEKLEEEDSLRILLEIDFKEQLINNHLLPFDCGSMANSLEMRVPFLDLENVHFATQLPLIHKLNNGEQKFMLKRVLRKLGKANHVNLEDNFFNRNKISFPQSFSSLFENIGQGIKADHSINWKEIQHYEHYFKNPFDFLWLGLTKKIFIDTR